MTLAPFHSQLILRGCILAATIALPLAVSAAAPVEKLAPLIVNETPSVADRYQLPQVTESTTALRIEETVNALDPEDAVKYLPSIFLRKRNYGDTQAVLASRVWGVSSSARSLVYADGVPLTALIANNNNIGGPRWGLVAPAEIERVDLMYGPFAAAYPGNSMGAVVEITTRQPEKFEATLNQSMAWQNFSQYGTHDIYRTAQTAVTVGDRLGEFSFWISANYQDSHSQPLSYVTSVAFPAGTNGGFADRNKLGAAANVVGASGLLHTRMANTKIKAAYDFSPVFRATYVFGAWRNDADSAVESYLTNPAGQRTFAGLAGFASGYYALLQEHVAHSLSLRSHPRGDWKFEATASLFHMNTDRQRQPTTASATAAPNPTFGFAGRVTELGGTGWATLDTKGTWLPGGKTAQHVVSFGAHADRYQLYNPTFNTANWQAGGPSTDIATEGDGRTRSQALWLQDAWRLTPAVKVTLGARYEEWRAYDGLNLNGAITVHQPEVRASGFSPKATLAWIPSLSAQPSTLNSSWLVTASVGQAHRFATAAELFQLVSTGTTFTAPNPHLKPDDVLATELKIERQLRSGRIRVSLFQDDIRDAIITQFNPLLPGSTQLFSFLSNVDHVRARGVEFVYQQDHAFIRGLELQGALTYLDARTLALSGRASANASAAAALGKHLPNIPDWRASFVATYRPNQRWAFTLAGRYSGMLWTTLDNTEVNPNTYQGFAAWFVADIHANLRLNRHWSFGLGADNVLNRKYFLFHPFPNRTVVSTLKYAF